MDAFAVSVCKGISMKKMNWKKACIIGLYFGGFQAIMPVIGYFFGSSFESIITNIDHWIAFILLAIIGAKMIQEAFQKEEEEYNEDISVKTMIVLSIATSIDALAVGITFAFSKLAEEESDFVIYNYIASQENVTEKQLKEDLRGKYGLQLNIEEIQKIILDYVKCGILSPRFRYYKVKSC